MRLRMRQLGHVVVEGRQALQGRTCTGSQIASLQPCHRGVSQAAAMVALAHANAWRPARAHLDVQWHHIILTQAKL